MARLPGCWTSTLLCCAFLLTACGPSAQTNTEFAERRRVQCLDKFCEGDVEPKHASNEVALKVNGQWFIGPRKYFGAASRSAGFEWWEHKPLDSDLARPAEAQALVVNGNGYDISVEIFLRNDRGLMKGPSRFERLRQAEADGRLLGKTTLRPGLDMWRTTETDGLGPGLWYVATAHVDSDPNGAVLSCRDSNPRFDRCVTGFYWRPGIVADMRFRTRHSVDWPEIYQEAMRILQQLKERRSASAHELLAANGNLGERRTSAVGPKLR